MCVLERDALHVILFLAGLISFESFIRRMYIRGGDRKKILKFFLEEKLKYEKMKKMGEEIDQMTGIFHEMNNLIERRVNEFIGNLQAEMDVLNENFRTLQEGASIPLQLDSDFKVAQEKNERELEAMEWLFKDPGFTVHAQDLKDFYASEDLGSHSAYI